MPADPQIPKLEDVIKAALAARLVSVYTGIPAQVVDYDKATQTITAQIAILGAASLDETGKLQRVNIAPINHVPVCFPGTGPYSITWPLKQGDTVMLEFACGSIDRFMSIGGTGVDPMDDRRFAKDDAVAFTGLRAIPNALPSSAYDDTAMVIAAPLIKMASSSASEPPAINSELSELWTLLTTNGTGVGAGDAVIAALQAYKSLHPTFPAGAANVQLEKAT